MIHQEFDQVESTTKNIPWNQPRNIGKEGCLLPIEGNRKKLTKKAGKSPPAPPDSEWTEISFPEALECACPASFVLP